MNNAGPANISLSRGSLRIKKQVKKNLPFVQSLQIQHDRSLCNYSDLSTSLKVINEEGYMKIGYKS